MKSHFVLNKRLLQRTLTLLFLTGVTSAFAQQWTSISKSNPAGPEVSLVSSSEQKVVVDFTLGGFELTRVSTPNGIQQIVSVPKMASMLEAGAPDLPHFPIPAIIGDMAEMEVNVVKSEYIDYENVEIAPSKGNFSRQINPDDVPYTYGAMYSQNAFYPVTQATLEAPYILRDFRGQDIMVAPFAYNPVTKTLRVYHHLTIAMNKVSDNGVNPKAARKAAAKVSPETQAAYSSRFINYKQNGAKYTFIDDRGEMLVICANNYVNAMQPFVDWKNQSGRPTTMVNVTQAGGNNETQIKNYISNLYNNPEHNLTYVLFVGDYSDITPHSMSGGRSDNWFGQLEGSDYYPEVLVGRFSVQSVTDVQTHVNKVLYYERDMPAGLTWVDRGIGVSANEGAGSGHMGGEADYVHINYIRDTLLHYTYKTVTQQYSGVGSGTSAAAISADVNAGASIINYCNHGSQTSWGVASYSNSHVNALVNDYKWPFIWSVACLNGQFDGTCFAEAWLRATNNSTGVPTGAIGGMFSWISQPWTPPQTGQDEMVDILTEWKNGDKYNHTLGGASLNGSMYILDMHPSDNGATHNTWLLFGDPSLMVRTDNPVSMNTTCNPAVLMLGMSSLEVSAQNTAYGIATLMMDGEILATADIHNGFATMNFAPLSNVGTATLTVIGFNKVTEVISLEVLPAEGAYISVEGSSPNFAPVNVQTNLNMSFKNVGADPTQGTTTVSLSCADNRLSFTNSTASFGNLAPDATVELNNFSFIIAQGVADETQFQIDVTMTCGNQVWTGKTFVTATQAVLQFEEMAWAGSFVPGQTLPVMAKFKNVGHYKATNAVATINSTSQYVSIANSTANVGTINPDGYASCLFNVTVASNCPQSEQIPLNFTLNADGGLGAQGTGILKNTCNVVFVLNDSYGDGWNGNKLVVSFNDGTSTQNLTFTSGTTATYTLEIGNGVHVTLGWISGSYSSECSFTVSYEDGDLIYEGVANAQFEFDCDCGGGDFPVGTTQTSEFANGWNWWNSYIEADDLMDQLKAGLGADGKQIKSQTSFTMNYGSMWMGQLNSIENGQTYMIQALAPCSVDVTGMPVNPADHPITLNTGWKWIGYPCSETLSVNEALAGITPTVGDQIKAQNSFSTYYNTGWMGTLKNLTPGTGYMFKLNGASQTLVFPSGSRNMEVEENITADGNHWVPDVYAYPSNMTIMAVVELDDVELASENYELAAFANGEVRGSARLMYVEGLNRWMAFLTISGDETAELTFGLYDAETGMVETQNFASLQYETDAIVGSPDAPFVIRFRGNTGLDEWANQIQVFPNPVERGQNIRLSLPDEGKIHMEIVNAMGEVETRRATSLQTTTLMAPETPGVYTLRITVEGKGTYCRKLVVK